MKFTRIHIILALALINGSSMAAARMLLPLYALELGAHAFTVGVLAATFSVCTMLFAMPVGRLADRFGARVPLLVGSAVGCLGMLCAYAVSGFPAIFTAAAAMGLTTAIFNVTLQNLVGLLSEPQLRARNFSNYSLCKSTSDFLGPLIAGFSIEHSGYGMACLYVALMTFMPVAILALRKDPLRADASRAAHRSGGLGAMLAVPGVKKVLATSSLLNTGQDLYQFYMPVYAHSLGMAASTIGLILAMNSTAAFVVRMALPRLVARFKEEKLLAYAFYVGAASLLLVPLFQNAVILAMISFVFGLGMGCGGPIVTMLMFSSSRDGRSGEALGLKVMVNHLTKMVSPVVFGAIGSALGLFPMFWINALMLGAGAVLSRPGDASGSPGTR